MKYTLTVYSDINIPMYGKTVRNSHRDSYTTDDNEVIRKLIINTTDCPDYKLTEENIRREMGCPEINKENLNQIRTYYGFRRLICGDLLKNIEDDAVGTFKYEIPYEVNHFLIRDDENITSENEKQFDYYIELLIER